MADNRMISRLTVCSDEFTTLSAEAQALYFQFVIEADNFGFFQGAVKIVRSMGFGMEALEELVKNRFLIRFESNVYALRDWNVANGNYKTSPTKQNGLQTYRANFPKQLAQVFVTEDLKYELISDSNSDYKNLQATQYNARQGKAMLAINNAIHSQPICNADQSSNRSSMSPSESDDSSLDDDDDPDAADNNAGGGKPLAEQVVCVSPVDGKKWLLLPYMRHMACWVNGKTAKIVNEYRSSMEDKLIRFAFDMAQQKYDTDKELRIPNAYFKQVLEDYKKSGYTTEEQVKEHENRGWISKKRNRPYL